MMQKNSNNNEIKMQIHGLIRISMNNNEMIMEINCNNNADKFNSSEMIMQINCKNNADKFQ